MQVNISFLFDSYQPSSLYKLSIASNDLYSIKDTASSQIARTGSGVRSRSIYHRSQTDINNKIEFCKDILRFRNVSHLILSPMAEEN